MLNWRRPLYVAWLKYSGRSRQQEYFSLLRKKVLASTAEVQQLQTKYLHRLLSHAYLNTAYYHRQLSAIGWSPGLPADEVSLALRALPLLDKGILRRDAGLIGSMDLDKRTWFYNTSGGSTGEPIRFIQDREVRHWGQATKMTFDSWAGYTVGMPKVLLWGSERDLLLGNESVKTKVGRWLRNDRWLNTFRMSEKDMRGYVDRINDVRPVQILAYVEAAYELARFIEQEGLTVHSPRSVMTSAGTLFPHMREVIERVFQTRVFNRYGSREVGDIASECQCHCGLHICPLTQYVEIVRPDGAASAPEEIGEVVVTSLVNYAMPLIRYKIGDLAAWASCNCSCGSSWPLLQEVSGRVNSVIRTSKGSFSGAALTTLLYYQDMARTERFGSFCRYQLIQKSLNDFILRVVVEDGVLWDRERDRVIHKLLSALGEEVKINIQLVDKIHASSSGKHQYIWSEIH